MAMAMLDLLDEMVAAPSTVMLLAFGGGGGGAPAQRELYM